MCLPSPTAIHIRCLVGVVLGMSRLGRKSITSQKLTYDIFLRMERNIKRQLEWIAERDHLRIPVFLEKREFVVLQAADLVAWCHYYYLTTHGKPEARYEKAIDKLAELSNEWGLINLGDPHRIPSIVNIPVRDPNMRYKSVILRKDGRRRAVTHYWPKTKATEPKVNRKTLVLPAPPPLTFEQVQASAKRYDLLRSSGVQK
jgi:hypothetical protein